MQKHNTTKRIIRENIHVTSPMIDRIPYKKAKELVFAYGSVPDGYFGDRAKVWFAFYRGYTLIGHESGYHTAPIPLATDEREALWLLKHHPSARHITVTGAKEGVDHA